MPRKTFVPSSIAETSYAQRRQEGLDTSPGYRMLPRTPEPRGGEVIEVREAADERCEG